MYINNDDLRNKHSGIWVVCDVLNNELLHVSLELLGAAKKLAKPTNNSSEQGTVVIKIWVDRSGKVINARMKVSGTNTSSTNLQKLALEAALKARFNTNPNATEVQTGTITYKFVL